MIEYEEKYKNHAVLKTGEKEGIEYKICFLRGGYYTAYLDVSSTELAYMDYNSIDLHVWWGLSYGDYRYPWEKERYDNKWIIGWDYGHCNDAIDTVTSLALFDDATTYYSGIGDVEHTLAEIENECLYAIMQIVHYGRELLDEED